MSNLENNSSIEVLSYQEQSIILVKTAHVSSQSVQDVKDAVERYQPQAIAVELDPQRLDTLMHPKQWETTDLISIIKKKEAFSMLVQLLLASYQKKIAKDLNMALGQEMITGVQLANEKQIALITIDRSIQTTFLRMWRFLGFWEKLKLITELLLSSFSDEEYSMEQIEQLKQSDMLQHALAQISQRYPMIKKVLIDERDQYMAAKIKSIKHQTTVVVIGAAHASGIKENLHKDHSIIALEAIPKKSFGSKLLPWLIPFGIVAIILATLSIDASVGLSQIQLWILINGTLSAIGTALVLAHPLTILTAFIIAPISSLSPFLAAGWFAGIVQTFMSKPTIKDMQSISEDVKSLKKILKNRILKILLVVIMANIFSSIGTLLSSIQIINRFLESLF